MIITALKTGYTQEEIKGSILSKEPTIKIIKVDFLYYPYYRAIFSVKAKQLFRKINGNFICTIDMINGVEAIANKYGEMEKIEVDDMQIVNVKLSEEEALQKASLFTSRIVMQKLKVLKVPQINLEHTGIFYKLFYIIQCRNNQSENLFILFDGVSAQFNLLDP